MKETINFLCVPLNFCFDNQEHLAKPKAQILSKNFQKFEFNKKEDSTLVEKQHNESICNVCYNTSKIDGSRGKTRKHNGKMGKKIVNCFVFAKFVMITLECQTRTM